jgi:FMN phosphatase YigB (HAD superfamily)
MTGIVDAVTFDYWNTLVWEERGVLRGRRMRAWAGILEEAGSPFGPERLERAFDDSWSAYEAAWEGNRQYLYTEAADEIIGRLGLEPPPDVRAALVEGFLRAAEGAELHLTDGVAECLIALRDAGVALGIVCDVGMTPSFVLRDVLREHGILESFTHWSFSDEVGVYKPDAAIFRHALHGLGDPDPARTAHVGDRRRTDVAGAIAMGMIAVRYRGVFDDVDPDEPEAAIVTGDLRELPRALGIA